MAKIILSDLFIGNFPVTQGFGQRPEYYQQFGFKGHEGVDFGCPVGTQIISATDGIVVRDVDDPKSGAYGVYVVVWDKAQGCATYYCHLSQNVIKTGDAVVKGQLLGYSGNTGNTSGPHLHFNLCRTNAEGIRIDTDNGYKGFVNPNDKRIAEWKIVNPSSPISIPAMTPTPNELVSQIASLKEQVNVYKQQIQDVAQKLGTSTDFGDVIAGIKRMIDLEDAVTRQGKELETSRNLIAQHIETISKLSEESNSRLRALQELTASKTVTENALEKALEKIIRLEEERELDQLSFGELLGELLRRLFRGRR